jgi:hypothetical protein
MIDLTNLIARVEAATGPDRGLDADILCAVRPEWKWDRSTQQPTGWVSMASGSGISCPAPHFTASVDDALTLIPPGWDVRHTDSNGGQWCLTLGRGDDNHPSYREVNSWPGDTERAIFNRRPLPLAICIAAMKARTA